MGKKARRTTSKPRAGATPAATPASGTRVRPAQPRWMRALPLAVLAAVALAYAPSFRVPFVFDDHDTIAANPAYGDPASFRWLYHIPANSTLMGRYATSWTFGLNALLFGHRPASYHAGNLTIHMLNVLLLAALVRHALRANRPARPWHAWAALATALVWGVHPLNTQAVTYLSMRGESLAATIYMLTLLACLKWDDTGRRAWRITAIACPLLAVLTKEHGWTAPCYPLVWAWVFQGRTPWREIRHRKGFYAAALVAWGLLAVLTLSSGRLEHVHAEPGITPRTYFLTQPEVLTHYLRLFAWPARQSWDYDWPLAGLRRALPWLLLWAALFATTCLAVWKRRPAGFAGAVVFLVLSSTSSFLPLPDLAYEYRFYLPGACAAALLVVPCFRYAPLPRAVPVTAAVLAALVLGSLTYRRNAFLQDEWNLWAEAAAHNPRGQPQRRALSNLGGLALARGRPAEALAYFEQVVEAGVPHRMQTRIYFQMGNANLDLGRLDAARAAYERALVTARDPAPIYANLGHVHLRASNWAAAREAFTLALAGMAEDPGLHFDLAYVSARAGDVAAAEWHFGQGCALGGRPQPALQKQIETLRRRLQQR